LQKQPVTPPQRKQSTKPLRPTLVGQNLSKCAFPEELSPHCWID
jgi:hypothetical protein